MPGLTTMGRCAIVETTAGTVVKMPPSSTQWITHSVPFQ